MVRLLEVTLIRVGNEEYAKHNESFGLATMRDRHVRVNGLLPVSNFAARAGSSMRSIWKTGGWPASFGRVGICPASNCFNTSMSMASGVRSTRPMSMPISTIAGDEFTAKDFRTWAGTVLAARALHEVAAFDSQAQAKRNVLRAVEGVAKRLGNTRAVCRKCYIHPEVVNAYLDGTLAATLNRKAGRELRSRQGPVPGGSGRIGLASPRTEEDACLARLARRTARHAIHLLLHDRALLTSSHCLVPLPCSPGKATPHV